MFEKLTIHGINSTDCPETICRPCLPKLTSFKKCESSQLEMLAIYHSHPASPARPSAEDISLALTPDVAYVIVSLQSRQPDAKAFLIEDSKAKEIALSIVETGNE